MPSSFLQTPSLGMLSHPWSLSTVSHVWTGWHWESQLETTKILREMSHPGILAPLCTTAKTENQVNSRTDELIVVFTNPRINGTEWCKNTWNSTDESQNIICWKKSSPRMYMPCVAPYTKQKSCKAALCYKGEKETTIRGHEECSLMFMKLLDFEIFLKWRVECSFTNILIKLSISAFSLKSSGFPFLTKCRPC